MAAHPWNRRDKVPRPHEARQKKGRPWKLAAGWVEKALSFVGELKNNQRIDDGRARRITVLKVNKCTLLAEQKKDGRRGNSLWMSSV